MPFRLEHGLPGKSVKLRKLSSNGRHVGVQASIALSMCMDASQLNDISKHAVVSQTYCNHEKNGCLHSLQTSGKGSLCTFFP